MESSELSAIGECQAGNLSAFDQLYTLHVDAVYRFLHRRTLVKEIAEDLTSVTFMKAMESIRSFKSDRGELRAWLYRIARNTLIDHYRKNRPSVDIESVWDLPSDDITEMRTEKNMDATALHEAMQTLSKDQRTIVLLRMWEGLSYKEIADLTGKTENNAKVIFSRAVSQLRSNYGGSATIALLALFPLSL
ncbi:sigma-70 family RNA polymerase sigma factor [Candidatus Peribacteria bacterium]|nr:MAG: sigma-70 family RNA polymerase sigma factor [Candidatus Peribacteria bacterium]